MDLRDTEGVQAVVNLWDARQCSRASQCAECLKQYSADRLVGCAGCHSTAVICFREPYSMVLLVHYLHLQAYSHVSSHMLMP